MKYYYYHILLLVKRIGLSLALFVICRIVFFSFNTAAFIPVPFMELMGVMFKGLRFDLSAIAYLHLLFILMHIVPGNFKGIKAYQSALKWQFYIVNLLAIVINLIDVEFFKFEGRRTTAEIFSDIWFGDDFKAVLPAMVHDFWQIILVGFLLVILMVIFYPEFKAKSNELYGTSNIYKILAIPVFFFVGFVTIVAMRGGFQLKPITIIAASSMVKSKYVPLALNTPFTLMQTLLIDGYQRLTYFTDNEVEKYFNPVQHFSSNGQSERKENVVVFILESMGSEYMGSLNSWHKGYTPFLDSLMTHSLKFNNAFSNGKRSIEALPAIIASIPMVDNNPFISSVYTNNRMNSLPGVLSANGYTTAMFHGGRNGTMGFEAFSGLAGFHKYFGLDQYPDRTHNDGYWGIPDLPFLQFMSEEIDDMPEPFMTCCFTLSSHHPYTLPADMQDRFPSGKLPIHRCIAYTDYALKFFFENARHKDWYNNTVFVFTADHTAQAVLPYFNTLSGSFRIPLFIYSPKAGNVKGEKNTVVQQTDIFPTIIDYLGIESTIVAFGKSALKVDDEGFAYIYNGNVLQWLTRDYLLVASKEEPLALYRHSVDLLLKENILSKNAQIADSLNSQLRAYIQQATNRIIDNRMVAE